MPKVGFALAIYRDSLWLEHRFKRLILVNKARKKKCIFERMDLSPK